MSYQLFDPTQPCTSLLPLNPVENKLTFYKVSVFEVSLEDIADIAELPAAYATPGAPSEGLKGRMRLGIPVSTLFYGLKEQYQEVMAAVADNRKIPVVMSVEGSFLPVNPKGPDPKPSDEFFVSRADVVKGTKRVGKATIKMDAVAQRRLSLGGVAYMKHGGRTVRLRLDTSSPAPARSAAAKAAPGARSARSGGTPEINQDFFLFGPGGVPDDLYEEGMLSLLADPRSYFVGFIGTERMGRVIAEFEWSMYLSVLIFWMRENRFPWVVLRRRGSQPGLVYSRPKLPRYDIGLFTTFEQTWALQGYSRGALLNSLTLAPQEELTIEVFTYDRRKIEEERTLTSEYERNTDVSAMASVAGNIARELSETNQMSGDIGLGLPLPTEAVPVNLDVGGAASLDVKANILSSIERVSEVTTRASERIKATRQVKVLEARESGREERVTRKIRNPNQGYTLTLNCYEVLESYQVETVLKSSKQFCLLVEQPDLGVVDVAFVLAYQNRLQQALLSQSYASGFEAARNLYAQDWFDNESIQKAEIEEAADQSVAATPPPTADKTIVVVGRQLADALADLFDADLMEAAEVLAEYYNPFDGVDVSKKAKGRAEATLGLFNYAFKLNAVSPGIEDRARTYMAALEADDSEAAVVAALGSFLAGADDEWVTNLKMFAASLVAAQLSSLLLIPFPILAPVFLLLAVIENNAGYPSLVGKAKQELKAYEVTASVMAPGSDASTPADLKTKEPPPQLLSLADLAMAHANFEALRLHIEANRVYYMNQVWKVEDPNARYERFRQTGIDAYVENRLLGFVGDRAIYPLRLSSLDPEVRALLLQKLTSFDPTQTETTGSGKSTVSVGPIQVGTQSVTLPTPAVYMDGALGRCELLEPYLVQRRDIERRLAQSEAELAEIRVAEARASLAGSVPVTTPNT